MLISIICDGCDTVIPLRGATFLSGGYVACPKCGKENHVPMEVLREPPSPPLTRDYLLAQVSRSLRETHPEEAEWLIREVEKRTPLGEPKASVGRTPMWLTLEESITLQLIRDGARIVPPLGTAAEVRGLFAPVETTVGTRDYSSSDDSE